MRYDLRLLDRDARVGAAESFSAPDNVAAAQVGALVRECCSDVFAGYEVWRGSECIARTIKGRKVTPEDVVLARQENILDLEDRLQTTFACVRRSKMLMQITAQWREKNEASESSRSDERASGGSVS
jgi:hypothetical protein